MLLLREPERTRIAVNLQQEMSVQSCLWGGYSDKYLCPLKEQHQLPAITQKNDVFNDWQGLSSPGMCARVTFSFFK